MAALHGTSRRVHVVEVSARVRTGAVGLPGLSGDWPGSLTAVYDPEASNCQRYDPVRPWPSTTATATVCEPGLTRVVVRPRQVESSRFSIATGSATPSSTSRIWVIGDSPRARASRTTAPAVTLLPGSGCGRTTHGARPAATGSACCVEVCWLLV